MAPVQVDLAILAAAVRHVGGEPAQVVSALAAFMERLSADGHPSASRLYVYRATGAGSGSAATPPSPARSRFLLAFLSADDALSFAQRTGLARAPRLMTLSPARALAVMVQREALQFLHIAYNDEPTANGLPAGWRLSRADILAMFAINSV